MDKSVFVDLRPLNQIEVVQVIRSAETLDEAVKAMNGLAANGWLTLWDKAKHHDGTCWKDNKPWYTYIGIKARLMWHMRNLF